MKIGLRFIVLIALTLVASPLTAAQKEVNWKKALDHAECYRYWVQEVFITASQCARQNTNTYGAHCRKISMRTSKMRGPAATIKGAVNRKNLKLAQTLIKACARTAAISRMVRIALSPPTRVSFMPSPSQRPPCKASITTSTPVVTSSR